MRVFNTFSRRMAAVIGGTVVMAVCFVLLWTESRKPGAIPHNTDPTVEHLAATPVGSSEPEMAVSKATDVLNSAEEAAFQKELLKREKHEKLKRKWMKSIGMENEGTRPVVAELRSISGTLTQYHVAYGEYPQGDAKEVAAALLGRVPGRKAFLAWNHSQISSNGELLDPWGLPYLIQISGEKIEIRSAGPNGIVWDADDETLK